MGNDLANSRRRCSTGVSHDLIGQESIQICKCPTILKRGHIQRHVRCGEIPYAVSIDVLNLYILPMSSTPDNQMACESSVIVLHNRIKRGEVELNLPIAIIEFCFPGVIAGRVNGSPSGADNTATWANRARPVHIHRDEAISRYQLGDTVYLYHPAATRIYAAVTTLT
ncbi:hypothetical protein ES703_59534 [subsurface metagenome]